MISSVRRCTLGGIISRLNGDASIALVPESANFDRRRGSEVATKYRVGQLARDGRDTPCPTACSILPSGSGWTPSHNPKNNGGTRSAAHKRSGGVVPVPVVLCAVIAGQAGRHLLCIQWDSQTDRGTEIATEKEGWAPYRPGAERGSARRHLPLLCPCGSRLRCQAEVRTAQAERRQSTGRALGRREHLRRGFASSAPGMKDIRNPARLIAGRWPITSARSALAPLPQPASQGPS